MTRTIINSLCSIVILTFSFFSEAARPQGGVSGGGGNIINSELLNHSQDPEMIEHIILKSHIDLKKYIQFKKMQFEAGHLNAQNQMIYAKLFRRSAYGSKTKVAEVLRQTRLVVKENEPCLTPENERVDGSFFVDKKSSMCISAERFSQKVSYANVKNESVALMLHEVGEIAGLSEAEAVLIQKQALFDLSQPVH